MSAVELIGKELESLGYTPERVCIDGLGGDSAAVIDYPVRTGRFKGQTFRTGIAFQEAGYPEFPPHFVWIANIESPKLPAHSTCEHDGVQWSAFSFPPSDFWDRLPLPEKNMKTYMSRHMQRVWGQL